jgi:hypothetical protein
MSELTSHHFDMGIEMDCEDEGVNDGYPGVATGTDEERVFKKSLFKVCVRFQPSCQRILTNSSSVPRRRTPLLQRRLGTFRARR